MEPTARKTSSRKTLLIVLAMMLAGLSLTALLAYWHDQQNRIIAETSFARYSDQLSEAVQNRILGFGHGLRGLRGIFITNPATNRATFEAYAASRDLEKEFPGAVGMGFVRHVPRSQLTALIEKRRAELGADYALRQQGTNPGDAMVVDYYHTAMPGEQLIGFDIGSDAARREAAMRSMWTNDLALSAPTEIAKNDRTNTLSLLLPIYRRDVPIGDPQQRADAIFGWSMMVLDVHHVLAGLTDEPIDYELFDVVADEEPKLIFDADHHLPIGADLAAAESSYTLRGLVNKYDLKFGNRTWQLLVSPQPIFYERLNLISPLLTMVGGAIATFLMTLVVYLLLVSRQRAEVIAEQMTEHLRLDQQRASDFSVSASDWFWETDAKHCFSFFSDNFEQVYGLRPQQVLGKSRRELLRSNPHNTDGLIEAHLAQLEAHQPFKDFEYRIISNDGTERWISVSGIPHNDANGRFAGYRGTGSIVTERKLAEAALRESEANYKELVQNVNAIILRMGVDGTVTYFNEYAEHFFGYRADEILGHHVVGTIVPETESNTGRDLSEMIAHLLANPELYADNENENMTRDGRRVMVRWANQVILDDNRQPSGVLSIGTDITAQKKAEETLILAKEAAESASRAKSQFLATMSHELRTPLNGIIGTTDLLRMINSDPEQSEHLETVMKSAQHLTKLIARILEYAQLDAGTTQFQANLLDVREVVQQAINDHKRDAEQKSIHLDRSIDPRVPEGICGYAGLLRWVLSELVNNAVDFTDQGEIRVAVVPDPSGMPDQIQFSVSDTGQGMSADVIERLFQPFQQADGTATRAHEGIGLGLALSQKRLAVMGGRIWVESEPGKGSTFYFTLPFHQDS